MNRFLVSALAVSTLLASPLAAEDTSFNEDAVAAMKGGIVIEAPWGVSMKKDEIIVFMTIHNGGEESDVIKAVKSDVAETVGIANFEGGSMRDSKNVETLDTPKGEATTLDQDGYHLVLTDLTEEIESGDTVPLTLEFEDTGDLDVQVSITVIN